MKLKWHKSGLKVWIGTDWGCTYTIELRPIAAMSERYCVCRGGIASTDRFGSTSSLPGAKRMAQEDHNRHMQRIEEARAKLAVSH